MSELPKQPEWKHDQQLSFRGLRDLLTVVKERLEETIKEKKAEVAGLTAARDSLRK